MTAPRPQPEDLPDDVHAAVCNGIGPARMPAWLRWLCLLPLRLLWPGLFRRLDRSARKHDFDYARGGTDSDRMESDQRFGKRNARAVPQQLDAEFEAWNSWADADGIWYSRTVARRLVLIVVLVALQVRALAVGWLGFVALYGLVRVGGGARWLHSWSYRRGGPATVEQLVAEVRAQLEQRAKVGER